MTKLDLKLDRVVIVRKRAKRKTRVRRDAGLVYQEYSG